MILYHQTNTKLIDRSQKTATARRDVDTKRQLTELPKNRHIRNLEAEQRVARFSTNNSSTVRMSAITSCGTTKWMCLHTVSITMANSIVTIHKQLCLRVPSNMHAYINKEMHLNYISNIYIPKDASNTLWYFKIAMDN